MNSTETPAESLVLAYLSMRKAIGVLGVALPFVMLLGGLILFGTGIQGSISRYDYTGMRDVLVGILCAIGVFLLSYKGHDWRDNWAGNLTCLCAVCLAVIPTAPAGEATALQQTLGTVHLVAAALFFLTLAYFSLCLFTKTHLDQAPTPKKLQRNRIYRICGFTILGTLLVMANLSLLPGQIEEDLKALHAIYWLESLAVVAFGVSWLVKGQAILRDGK